MLLKQLKLGVFQQRLSTSAVRKNHIIHLADHVMRVRAGVLLDPAAVGLAELPRENGLRYGQAVRVDGSVVPGGGPGLVEHSHERVEQLLAETSFLRTRVRTDSHVVTRRCVR